MPLWPSSESRVIRWPLRHTCDADTNALWTGATLKFMQRCTKSVTLEIHHLVRILQSLFCTISGTHLQMIWVRQTLLHHCPEEMSLCDNRSTSIHHVDCFQTSTNQIRQLKCFLVHSFQIHQGHPHFCLYPCFWLLWNNPFPCDPTSNSDCNALQMSCVLAICNFAFASLLATISFPFAWFAFLALSLAILTFASLTILATFGTLCCPMPSLSTIATNTFLSIETANVHRIGIWTRRSGFKERFDFRSNSSVIWQTSEAEVNVCLAVFRAHVSHDSGMYVIRNFSHALNWCDLTPMSNAFLSEALPVQRRLEDWLQRNRDLLRRRQPFPVELPIQENLSTTRQLLRPCSRTWMPNPSVKLLWSQKFANFENARDSMNTLHLRVTDSGSTSNSVFAMFRFKRSDMSANWACKAFSLWAALACCASITACTCCRLAPWSSQPVTTFVARIPVSTIPEDVSTSAHVYQHTATQESTSQQSTHSLGPQGLRHLPHVALVGARFLASRCRVRGRGQHSLKAHVRKVLIATFRVELYKLENFGWLVGVANDRNASVTLPASPSFPKKRKTQKTQKIQKKKKPWKNKKWKKSKNEQNQMWLSFHDSREYEWCAAVNQCGHHELCVHWDHCALPKDRACARCATLTDKQDMHIMQQEKCSSGLGIGSKSKKEKTINKIKKRKQQNTYFEKKSHKRGSQGYLSSSQDDSEKDFFEGNVTRNRAAIEAKESDFGLKKWKNKKKKKKQKRRKNNT